MLVVFALGMHFFLIAIYGCMMIAKRSRLELVHLLWAAFFPFAGEICLLAAEFGHIPANPIYRTELNQKAVPSKVVMDWKCPENWKEIVLGEDHRARKFLMQAIDSENKELPEMLKTGLFSSSSEVSHMAAARLMKMHCAYEDAIAEASAACNHMPHNMSLLASYIDAVDAYRSSGLPDSFSYENLKREELALIECYLRNMPRDSHYKAKWAILSETEEEKP